ncbi:MAG: hypothetical protein ACR2ML_05990 [Solirubrobacteraceae bacterium]
MQPKPWSRLRWRMRGAWLWPAFAAASVVGGVLLERLPVAGEGTGLVAGILLAGFLNLIAVILLGAAGGLLLRRRRPDVPREVARDYAGTVAVVLVCTLLLAAGLVHRPAVIERQRDFTAQSLAARRFLAHRAPPDVRPNVALADSLRLDEDLYRTCAPRRETDRAFCLYVDTSQSPPGISVDSNRAPNRRYLPDPRRR